MDISIGYSVTKPVDTQKKCDLYEAMANAVNEHNADVKAGEVFWMITEEKDRYTVVKGETAEAQEEDPNAGVSDDDRFAAIEDAISELAAIIGGE